MKQTLSRFTWAPLHGRHVLLVALFLVFMAVLIQQAQAAPGGVDQSTAVLILPRVHVLPGSQTTVPLILQSASSSVYSADITVRYDPAVTTAVDVVQGGAVPDWSLARNLQTSGEVRIAVAGARPLTGVGELVVLTFQAVEAEGSATALTLTRGDLNEGSVPAALQHGQVVVSASPCYDLVEPPGVGVTDIQLVAALWRQRVSPPYDGDEDGMITVADIMRVAAAWGDTCPSWAND